MKTFLLVAFALLACSMQRASAQPSIPEWGDAFLQDEVAEIRITIDPDSLSALLDPANGGNEYEWPATFEYHSSTRHDTLHYIGFRMRGNTSLNAAKKSFKISINSFIPGLKWLGLEKLNLVANQNDPSLLRAKLCWDMIRRYNLAGSRTSYVRLYINDEYRGLYIHTEHIDEQFTSTYFGDESAHLWKCTYPADLLYLGANPDLYKLEAWGYRVYELKTNTEQDDYSDLAEFISVLNNTSAGNLTCALEKVFNVDDYLKYLAIDVLTGNWDNHAFNRNNFYLLRNERTGVIEYIPYDLDNTLGVDWIGEDWTERNVYSWSQTGQERPLYERLLANPVWRNQFTYYLETFTSDWFHEDGIISYAAQLQELIAPHAIEDAYRPLDYGYTENDFLNAIDEAWGGHVDYGLRDYVNARRQSMLNQIESFSTPQVANHVHAILSGNELVIRATVEPGPAYVAAYRQWPGGSWNSAPVLTTADAAPGGEEQRFAFVDIPEPVSSVEFNVMSQTAWNNFQNGSCASRYIHIAPGVTQVVINEVQSVNASTITDNAGQADDWIELYNAGTSPQYLGSSFISDDPLDWNKWRLPNVTLDPGDFLLLWADRDPEQGPLHLGFRLAATGEPLLITEVVQRAPRRLDQIAIPPLNVNQTFGRTTDGASTWMVFTEPTPNGPNGVVKVSEIAGDLIPVWPNPTDGPLHFNRPLTGRLLSSTGQEVMTLENARSADISLLSPGLYILDGGSWRIRIVRR